SKDGRGAAQCGVAIGCVSFFRSAQVNKIQGFVLSFPLFRRSRYQNLPRVQCDPRAEGDIGFCVAIPRSIRGPGDVAQLGEHLLCKQGVSGSNPLISTSTLTTE